MTLLINRRGARTVLRLLSITCLAIALGACGLTAPRSSDGYADLESLGMRDTDNVMTLSIGPALLHFAASLNDSAPTPHPISSAVLPFLAKIVRSVWSRSDCGAMNFS